MSIVKTYKANPSFKFKAHCSDNPGCPHIFKKKDGSVMLWDPDKKKNNKIFFTKKEFEYLKKFIQNNIV